MKPFNLSAALAGDRVVTRDGREVKHLVHLSDATAERYTVVGVVGEFLMTWTTEGQYQVSEDPSNLDIVMKTTKKSGWVNVYSTDCEPHMAATSMVYDTKELADFYVVDSKTRLDCVLVTWEE